MRMGCRCLWILGVSIAVSSTTLASETPAPIVSTIRFSSLEAHVVDVSVSVPTEKKETIELMMAVWSPGYYHVDDYANQVQSLVAKTVDGKDLTLQRTAKNRWRIAAGGVPTVVVSYRLLCNQRSVTTNWVGPDLAVLNGPATFVTLIEKARRPHEVRLELPSSWQQSQTALPPAPDGLPNHYRAEDYDTLADSPIVAGNPTVYRFDVEGSEHVLVDLGDVGNWNGQRARADLAKIALENRRFWGSLPFKKYVFLNVFRPGGGGLEHRDSCLLSSNSRFGATPEGYLHWLEFVGHEYHHAFNVKRLRPVELGPFDYEHPPRTGGLWVSEGITTYYGELLTIRAGFGTGQDFLTMMSGHIRELQSTPGRKVQTLEQSSLNVWATSASGIGMGGSKTGVSFYTKGPVVAFLLDARIRRATAGRKSLDDAMRLAYARHSGSRGFTPDEFRLAIEQGSGLLLGDWLGKALSTTEELNYAEALFWYGLQFQQSADPAKTWTLEPRPDATEAQKTQLRSLFKPSQG